MSAGESFNPFPGPQPYRAADRHRFFGRERATQRLVNRILARPCVTFFGPSGAGKSSLMQAAVIPLLQRQHGFRVVSVDAWLTSETPLERLVRVMFADLELGEVPKQLSPREALGEALRLAERYSDRPILLYLDQLETPLRQTRIPGELAELFEQLGQLARLPLRGLQLVLSLREDYLGRFRDRVREQQSLQDPGFRLGPLTVKEMARVACQLAEVGEPAQHWSEQEMLALMLEMRSPGQAPTDEAEIQAAFAQIVCRALWEERRAAGGNLGPVNAEPILHRYLEATVEELGPLRADALRLLEEHLIAPDGSRTLLTESEARAALGEGTAEKVLGILERAAVLRAEEHQGSRYFELGHDWLANKVLELKREREEQRERQSERSARRRLVIIAAVAAAVALVMGALLIWAMEAQRRATDQALLVGAREQQDLGQPAMAARLLLEARHPDKLKGWNALAQKALDSNFLELTLHGTGKPLNAAIYDPRDDQYIVVVGEDGLLQRWRADGSEHSILGTNTAEGTDKPLGLRSAAFSSDGKRLVTVSRDGSARVWPVDEPERSIPLGTRAQQARTAAFSPDGQRIVLASQDGTAWVWPVDGWGPPLALDAHQPALTSAAFSPDGQHLVTTSWDGTARVWPTHRVGRSRLLETNKAALRSAAFSPDPDGERIVTASEDGKARVWWADRSSKQPIATFEGHGGPLRSAVFSRDGQRIVTASDDGTARVWQADGSVRPLVFEGHRGPVRSAEFSPDGQHVVTASWDGTVGVWQVQDQPMTPHILVRHQEPVTSAAFSPDGENIATASRDGTVRLWHANGSGHALEFEAHTAPIMSLTFSPDGQRLVTASRDKTARVWRINGWVWRKPIVLEGHTAEVSSAEFSPDGERIVTTSWDGTARVWRSDDGWRSAPREEPLVLAGHEGWANYATFSPDGQHVLTVDRSGILREWDANTGALLRQRAVHERLVKSVQYSATGRFILTSSNDGTARLWRADTWEELAEFKGHQGPVNFASFSPDEALIVTASDDKTVRVWRTQDPKQFKVLEAHEGPVYFAAFNPRGEYIVTASWDKTARLWPVPGFEPQPIPSLRVQLENDNQDCLDAELRQTYLNEKEKKARKNYEGCEKSHHRDTSPAWMSWNESPAAGPPKRRM